MTYREISAAAKAPTMGAQSMSKSIPGAIRMASGVVGNLRVRIATKYLGGERVWDGSNKM
jgi:hypothetical protein